MSSNQILESVSLTGDMHNKVHSDKFNSKTDLEEKKVQDTNSMG